jgi:hypothetical protein
MLSFPSRPPLLLVLAAVLVPGAARAQSPEYGVELGAGIRYQAWDYAADLRPEVGGVARLGVGLPSRFGLEAEVAVVEPNTRTLQEAVRLLGVTGSVLYNIPAGDQASFLVRLGGGVAKYGGDCPPDLPTGVNPCGGKFNLSAGVGARVHISRGLALRGDFYFDRPAADPGFFTYGATLGLSVLTARATSADTDGDGVRDRSDACPGTPSGARVDLGGCPSDGDGDGVLDGLDRCPATPAGQAVDVQGCPLDADRDGVGDALDRCPDTPAGAVVNESGCPLDQDRDGVPDGLDRCPATPEGATVDQLGCPLDADGDGVPDGVDRCAGTPAGTAVDAAGCPSLGGPWTLAAAEFEGATPLASAGARATLDQVADLLRRRPGLRLEVRGYGPIVGAGQPGRRAPLERAELVKASLVGRGVAAARIRTIGFAGQEMPRVTIVVQGEGR